MVQKQASPDFLDPVHERRRLFAETWGAFLLVHVAARREAALHARGHYVFGCLADPLCILVYSFIFSLYVRHRTYNIQCAGENY